MAVARFPSRVCATALTVLLCLHRTLLAGRGLCLRGGPSEHPRTDQGKANCKSSNWPKKRKNWWRSNSRTDKRNGRQNSNVGRLFRDPKAMEEALTDPWAHRGNLSEASEDKSASAVTIAVIGCLHGRLNDAYDAIRHVARRRNLSIDIVLIAGDFQAVRNEGDLLCMAVPDKYRVMGDFHQYYGGDLEAPYLTLYVGGNHEASNYHAELPFGGWVAPNIYYMGICSVIRFAGLRIAGLSGIYKPHDFHGPRDEVFPLTNETQKRSIYHTRKRDVDLLLNSNSSEGVDILLTHDWPAGITSHGNKKDLMRRKPFLKEDIMNGELGSPANVLVSSGLCPRYHFAAHLHTKFAATLAHNKSGAVTRFLALDKLLPGRHFLQILQISPRSHPNGTGNRFLEYDQHFLNSLVARVSARLEDERDFVRNMTSRKVPENFCQTAPSHINIPNFPNLISDGMPSPSEHPNVFSKSTNPQILKLEKMLKLPEGSLCYSSCT